MPVEGNIYQEKNRVELFQTDKVKKFNQQIVSMIDEKIETVQFELLNISNRLIEHGDLLEEIQF
ncbi:MAG TPA: hypothetical protein VN698_11925 [Bacteroidia bacterium]|nr:hypothetical protein [Bacteroidia bacterium]